MIKLIDCIVDPAIVLVQVIDVNYFDATAMSVRVPVLPAILKYILPLKPL